MNNPDEEAKKVMSDNKALIAYFEKLKMFGMVRFVCLPPRDDDKTDGTVIILLNDGFALWFMKNGDGWKYDGWEVGDYSEHNWEKFQFKPRPSLNNQ